MLRRAKKIKAKHAIKSYVAVRGTRACAECNESFVTMTDGAGSKLCSVACAEARKAKQMAASGRRGRGRWPSRTSAARRAWREKHLARVRKQGYESFVAKYKLGPFKVRCKQCGCKMIVPHSSHIYCEGCGQLRAVEKKRRESAKARRDMSDAWIAARLKSRQPILRGVPTELITKEMIDTYRMLLKTKQLISTLARGS